MAVDATQIAVTYSSVRMPLFTITKYINAQIATVNNNIAGESGNLPSVYYMYMMLNLPPSQQQCTFTVPTAVDATGVAVANSVVRTPLLSFSGLLTPRRRGWASWYAGAIFHTFFK